MLTIVSDLLLTDSFLIKGNIENKYTRLSQVLDEHRRYFVKVRDATLVDLNSCERINTPLLHRGSPEAMEGVLATLQPWPEAGKAEHIAAVAAFLASEDARFVTGEALIADGGLTAAGSGAIRTLSQGQSAYAASGMDQGSTGKEMTFRTIED